jgi:hypothetical protein
VRAGPEYSAFPAAVEAPARSVYPDQLGVSLEEPVRPEAQEHSAESAFRAAKAVKLEPREIPEAQGLQEALALRAVAVLPARGDWEREPEPEGATLQRTKLKQAFS